MSSTLPTDSPPKPQEKRKEKILHQNITPYVPVILPDDPNYDQKLDQLYRELHELKCGKVSNVFIKNIKVRIDQREKVLAEIRAASNIQPETPQHRRLVKTTNPGYDKEVEDLFEELHYTKCWNMPDSEIEELLRLIGNRLYELNFRVPEENKRPQQTAYARTVRVSNKYDEVYDEYWILCNVTIYRSSNSPPFTLRDQVDYLTKALYSRTGQKASALLKYRLYFRLQIERWRI